MNYQSIKFDAIARLKATGGQSEHLVALMEAYPTPTQAEWDACVAAAAKECAPAPPQPLACLRQYEERIYRGRIPSALGEFVANVMKTADKMVPARFAVDMCKLYLLTRGPQGLNASNYSLGKE